MANIDFNCPECGNHLSVDRTLCGRKAQCPFCEKKFIIPEDGEITLSVNIPATANGTENAIASSPGNNTDIPLREPDPGDTYLTAVPPAPYGAGTVQMRINGQIITDEATVLAVLEEMFSGLRPSFFMVCDNGFIRIENGSLEHYREGKLYRACNIPLTREMMISAILSYFRNDGNYLHNFNWQVIRTSTAGRNEYGHKHKSGSVSRLANYDFSGILKPIGSVAAVVIGLLIFLFSNCDHMFSSNMEKNAMELANKILTQNNIPYKCVKIHGLPDSLFYKDITHKLEAELDNGEKVPFEFSRKYNNFSRDKYQWYAKFKLPFTVQAKKSAIELVNQIMANNHLSERCNDITGLPDSTVISHGEYRLVAVMDNGERYNIKYTISDHPRSDIYTTPPPNFNSEAQIYYYVEILD